MPAQKIIKHPIIGEYKIIKKNRSRVIRLSINESKGVRVTIPIFTPFNEASDFLESNLEWVLKSLEKEKQKKRKQALNLNRSHSIKLINGELSFFEDKNLTSCKCNTPIKLDKTANNSSTSWLITFAKGVDSIELTPYIITALKDAAKEYLPNRAQYFANRYGFSYNKLFLKNNKSNWGSCSSLNNINLNIHLMRLPSELCDYVILHELTHLKHRNHGKEFHKYLNSLCGGKEKELSKKLKEFYPTILFQ
ncbi:MAG: SprT family zinc-dependent metalloprotease [Bacteroidales bacterium]|nr:SprT family zinc-dependent metalloprotease [Bacteroidales bacterium]MDD4656256.1 SprT family zinc-dependent metalloprotease [Bacteroidales bacterium]